MKLEILGNKALKVWLKERIERNRREKAEVEAESRAAGGFFSRANVARIDWESPNHQRPLVKAMNVDLARKRKERNDREREISDRCINRIKAKAAKKAAEEEATDTADDAAESHDYLCSVCVKGAESFLMIPVHSAMDSRTSRELKKGGKMKEKRGEKRRQSQTMKLSRFPRFRMKLI